MKHEYVNKNIDRYRFTPARGWGLKHKIGNVFEIALCSPPHGGGD